jgi:hypothetical protein
MIIDFPHIVAIISYDDRNQVIARVDFNCQIGGWQ